MITEEGEGHSNSNSNANGRFGNLCVSGKTEKENYDQPVFERLARVGKGVSQ